jgi:hypothetical protein
MQHAIAMAIPNTLMKIKSLFFIKLRKVIRKKFLIIEWDLLLQKTCEMSERLQRDSQQYATDKYINPDAVAGSGQDVVRFVRKDVRLKRKKPGLALAQSGFSLKVTVYIAMIGMVTLLPLYPKPVRCGIAL